MAGLSHPNAGWAADPAPAEPPPPAAPATLALGEVGSRAEKVAVQIGGIEQDLESSDVAERAAGALDALDARIDLVQERLEEVLGDDDRGGSLSTLDVQVGELEAALTREAERIGGRAQALDERVDELDEELALWNRTREKLAPVPPAVLPTIDGQRRSLREARARVEGARNEALAIQARIVAQQQRLAPVRKAVNASVGELAAAVFARQREPLWKAPPSARELIGAAGRARERLSASAERAAAYLRAEPEAALLQVVVILALATAFVRTRRALEARFGETGATDESVPADIQALRRPMAAGLLLGLLLTPYLHASIAFDVRIWLTLVALPAWLRLMGALVGRNLFRPLVGLAALALLDVARRTLLGLSALSELVLLAELLVGLAGVLWLQRPARLADVPATLGDTIWARGVALWLRLTSAILAVGFVAGVSGYEQLALRVGTLAIWGTFTGTAWLGAARLVEALLASWIEGGRLDGLHLVRHDRTRVLAMGRTLLRVAAFGAWFVSLLRNVQALEAVRSGAAEVLSAEVGYGQGVFTLGGVLAFLLTLYLSWILARFVAHVLDAELFARLSTPPGVPYALTSLARYAILVVGFILALATAGVPFDRAALVLSALGVGIGFGLQHTVNNFISGIILLFERPIRVGDMLQLDDLWGVVSSIGIRASTVRTFDGSDVVVPNGDLIANRVVNWTLADRKRRIILPVGVAYGSKPRDVLRLLLEVARRTPEVLEHPAPEALFRSFGDSSLDFELRVWTESERGWLAVMSDVGVEIVDAFEAAGIVIPFPQRDVHVRELDSVKATLRAAVEEAGGDGRLSGPSGSQPAGGGPGTGQGT